MKKNIFFYKYFAILGNFPDNLLIILNNGTSFINFGALRSLKLIFKIEYVEKSTVKTLN